MKAGFFDIADVAVSKAPPSLLPHCGACGLWRHCASPKMQTFGAGQRKILLIAEAPGKLEDSQGRPLVDSSGQVVKSTLARFGVDMDRDCWITNALICHPKNEKGNNRTPTDLEISYCQPNVIRTVQELKPEIILLLGGTAVKSLLGWLWKEDIGAISRWDGWRIPCQKLNAFICPTWHPAALLHGDSKAGERESAIRRLFFERHIEAACKLRGRPWKQVPNWEAQCEAIVDTDEAAQRIKTLIERCRDDGTPVAIDYETENIKPDSDGIEIVTCAISDGRDTFGYPWHGKTVEATEDLLLDDSIGKVAANLKFEHRFTKAKLGFEVRHWLWDTMLAAHVLDNRPGIVSLKFQAFVLFGQDSYDDHIKPYFAAKDNNSKSRIRELPLHSLITYNCMDALLEWKIAKKQMRMMGLEFKS